jgi:hypothetical protein
MSSDDKFAAFDEAEIKYNALRELFSKALEVEFYSGLPARLKDALNEYNALRGQFLKASEAGYYSRLPAELEGALRKYEQSKNFRVCLDFDNALTDSWRQVKLPSELMPELEEIITMSPEYR